MIVARNKKGNVVAIIIAESVDDALRKRGYTREECTLSSDDDDSIYFVCEDCSSSDGFFQLITFKECHADCTHGMCQYGRHNNSRK